MTDSCKLWQNVTVRCCLYFHGWEWGVSQSGDIVNQPLITSFCFSLCPWPQAPEELNRCNTRWGDQSACSPGHESVVRETLHRNHNQRVQSLVIIFVTLKHAWRSELGGETQICWLLHLGWFHFYNSGSGSRKYLPARFVIWSVQMSEKPLNTSRLNQLKAANVSVGMSRESGTGQNKSISMSVVMFMDYFMST